MIRLQAHRRSGVPVSSIAVGALVHDGPATPEQISLYLPVTGTVAQTATATCRYKETSSGTWITGHPLYRTRPSFSETPQTSPGTVTDCFAWPILNLLTGTSYDIEVTVTEGAASVVKTLTHVTRALPAAAGAANKNVNSGMTQAAIQAVLNGLVPGDVLEFADGTYTLSVFGGFYTIINGTLGQLIYIRGQSRNGTIINNTYDAGGQRIFQYIGAAHLVLENMTLMCTTPGTARGIDHHDSGAPHTRCTFRNLTLIGVYSGITGSANMNETLVYDCTMSGPFAWIAANTDNSSSWGLDGIQICGSGNAAFNNTVSGFGDSLPFAAHADTINYTVAVGTSFYRNDVHNSCDDLCESDYSFRNCAFYDNRSRNSMTLLSIDPLYAGPFVCARNIAINVAAKAWKWNSTQSGMFVYNNTIVNAGAYIALWYQPGNSGEARSYGYRNNIMINRAAEANTLLLDNTGHEPLDFTHNAWFPDGTFDWNDAYGANLAAVKAIMPSTTPVFSGEVKRHQNDVIILSNPFVTNIVLGADYHTEITTEGWASALADGGAARNAGIAIPGITDGFTGAAPDMGAIITGRAVPTYGDRS